MKRAARSYVAIVAWEHGHGAVGSIVPAFAVLFLAIGSIARIVVGAHWPSDLWMANLMGLFWITLLLPLSRQQPIETCII
jgi:membrane-associated phospholipid phosphatase